ncbi:MFS general substrate transporter [Peniophora sp. CONT]|nr:MFS general substrate transporter [Peniophora sp. CONT]
MRDGEALDKKEYVVSKESYFDSSAPSRVPSPVPPLPHCDAPDGGLTAWLLVAGSFFLIFNSWGIFNSFGAFQAFYQEDILLDTTASTISWIGSVEGALLLMGGLFSGPVFDLGYFRALASFGSLTIVFGIMMLSLSTEYYQIFLSQGLVVGIGCGCLFVPSMAIISTYFHRRRALASGIAMSASALGGVVYPAVFRQLQPQIGFAWATRTIGFIALVLSIFALSVMKQRETKRTKRAFLELGAFRETPYTMFCIANALTFMGAYVPFFYGTAFVEAHTGASKSLAIYVVAILNAASTVGRILPNFFADICGPLNVLTPTAFATAVVAFCWIPVHDVGGFAAFGVLYGLLSGALIALGPGAIGSLTADVGRVGTRMGMAFGIAGLGLLVGTPSAGALVDLQTGSFLKAQIFNGVVVLTCAFFMLAARVSKVGWEMAKA